MIEKVFINVVSRYIFIITCLSGNTTMWLLLVTTVAAAVFADAGYHYNVPNVPFALPSSQPDNFAIRPIQVLPQNNINIGQENKKDDKPLSYSISYKDFVFLKRDNVANNIGHVQQLNSNYNNLHINHPGNNGGLLVSHNVQNNLGGLLNNGYTGYVQSANNINSNNANSYVLSNSIHSDHQHTAVPISVGANVDHAHSTPLYTNNNLNVRYVQPNELIPANVYTQLPTNVIQNTGYIASVSAPNSIDYASQRIIPTGGHQLNNGYLQGTTADGAYNQAAQTTESFNRAYSHIAQSSASLNNAYSQVAQNSASLNNACSQVAQISASLNDAYSQVAQVSAHANDAHSQIETSSAEVSLDSGYAQFAPSPDTSTINSGYKNAATEDPKLNNGHDQTITTSTSSSSQVNTGYEQVSSTAASISTVFTPSQAPTTSGGSGNEYSETSTGPSHVDLNADISQIPTSFATVAGSSLTSQTIITRNDASVDNGLVQNNLVADLAINPIPATVPTSPPVTPIIHKHVYFHVPPSDLEESQKVIPLPPASKKNYKILFIKVPSQQSNTNVANLQQQIAQLQNAAFEDRTLIYLLVKTPQDPVPVYLPKPKPSEHQVFFVQYHGSPSKIASQVNEELDKTGSVKSIVPLEPGLINGQHK